MKKEAKQYSVDFLVWDFPPSRGGIQAYCYETIRRLAQLYPVRVMAPKRQGSEESSFDSKQDFVITRFWVPKRWGEWLGIRFFLLRAFLWGIFHSFLHRHSPLHCTHLVMGLVGYGLNRIFGTSYVVWTYGLEVTSFSKLWVKPVLQRADYVLTISELTKRHLLALGVSANRIVKVCPGINPPLESPQLQRQWEEIESKNSLRHCKILLTVGSLTKLQRYKGVDIVLQVLPTIFTSFPQTRYLIAGSGDDLFNLIKLAEQLGVASKVHFMGTVSDEELAALYAHCDIFVMPSRELSHQGRYHFEGFGIVFLEASAFGKPVIGGNGSGAEDAIIHNETGFLIDPLDVHQLGTCILHLLKDGEFARRLGEKGRARVLSEFGWDQAVSQPVQPRLRRAGWNRAGWS